MDVTKPRNPRYVGLLALASCLILIGGWLARPRDVPQNPVPVPSETELEQLARRTERRSLDRMAKYFAGVAKDAEASVARVRSAQGSGVVWDEERIVTARIPRRQAARVASVAAAPSEADGQDILMRRDQVTTGIAGTDPSLSAVLKEFERSLRQALGYSVSPS